MGSRRLIDKANRRWFKLCDRMFVDRLPVTQTEFWACSEAYINADKGDKEAIRAIRFIEQVLRNHS